ncbi:MAG: Gfo/Idh/MocA family oxidoreductase [Candidatus Omnitrophica bacterium]|nr:Gfo/Idh/MocA family oxidoreductase [Candidatus Omnitrophota bacterium]
MKKKILIAGAGGIGRKHVEGFLRTGSFSVSICDTDFVKTDKIKADYPVEDIFNDFNSINLNDFEAVLISTPANYHVPMASLCAVRGVPFLLEKPLSLNMDGVDVLVNAVKKNNVKCAAGFTRRSIPSFVKLRELLGEKKVMPKTAVFSGGGDYRKYRPDYRKIYFARKSMGGGCILDSVSHVVDLAQWYLGKPADGYCLYDNLIFGDTVETEDCAVISARFGGALVSISNNVFQKPYTFFMEFIGEKGNMRYVMDGRRKAAITFSGDDSGKWEELACFENEIPDFYVNQAKNFLNLLEGKRNTMTTIEEAAQNLEFLLRVKKKG